MTLIRSEDMWRSWVACLCSESGKIDRSIPICSMYWISINIYLKNHPNESKYTIHWNCSTTKSCGDAKLELFPGARPPDTTFTSWYDLTLALVPWLRKPPNVFFVADPSALPFKMSLLQIADRFLQVEHTVEVPHGPWWCWWFEALWKIWQSMGRIISSTMENKTCSKPPARIYIYNYLTNYHLFMFNTYPWSTYLDIFGLVDQQLV